MAEFCAATAADLDFPNDFTGLWAPDEVVFVLCEGGGTCPGGFHAVDHDGVRVDEDATKT